MSGAIQSNPGVSGEIVRDGYGRAAPRALEGQYRGERVVLRHDQSSLLADAAEELTFQFGEVRQKALAKRIIQTKVANQHRLREVSRVHDLLDRLGDLRKDVLERVVATLARQRFNQFFDLREEVRAHLPEPAHQYAALLALLEKYESEDAPAEQRAAVTAALDQLEDAQGPAIRAAFNIGPVTAQFAVQGLGDIQDLRDTYRDSVLDTPDLAQTLTHLIERHGAAGLAQSVQYLIKALGADLGADGASIDRVKLRSVLDDLHRLEVLTGLLEECETLVTRHRAPGNQFAATDLLKEVLALQVNQWPRADAVARLPPRLGVVEIAGEINVLREFKDLVRMIPLKSYTDPDQRTRQLEAVQQALDAAIEREEGQE